MNKFQQRNIMNIWLTNNVIMCMNIANRWHQLTINKWILLHFAQISVP